jgi:gluconate 2-dehydrogenase gamma chain
MVKVNLNRRRLLVAGATVATAPGVLAMIHDGELGAPPQTVRGTVPWEEGAADAPPEIAGTDFKFFTNTERAFIEAAIERLIPGDPVGPGALESGVAIFLDRQLFGPYGRGDHFFLGGPWPKGTPQQGYQSRFSPAQLYRAAIAAIDKHVAAGLGAASFAKLDASAQDGLLKALAKNDLPLEGGVDGKTFFDMLLQNTKEGYFSDPIYGGNKGMGAWKMIGFPGAHYDYLEWVERHGEPVPYPAVGLKGRPGWREV